MSETKVHPQPLSPSASAAEILRRHFGFSEFRSGQLEIIEAILHGENALVIMPTGGGKSLCYQLPALARDGVAIVVSPLIALMKDQVDALQAKGVAADFINSTLSGAEQRERIQAMRAGKLRLVYVAPERFRSAAFLDALQSVSISLFAVDEAHCISQWGHDFRPDYSRIGEVLGKLGRPQTIALTATATPAVREDILRVLQLEDARTFIAGFARPNLSLGVRHVRGEAEKLDRLVELIEKAGTGIVYCSTRKKVERVAEELRTLKISHVAYHGGMDESARTSAQERFLTGETNVAVATNAFGMGIDRQDLRFVIHFDIPGSIEAYYQEVGRAGRDGLPSECELFFMHPDIRTQEFFIDGANPSIEMIHSVWNCLRSRANDEQVVKLSVADLASLLPTGGNDMSVSSALVLLSRAGVIERYDVPGERSRGTRLLKPDLPAHDLPIDPEKLEQKERVDRERLQLMVDFAYSQECRQKFLLRILGENDSARCGTCDRCGDRTRVGERSPEPDEAVLMQKLLSCVARMSWRSGNGWEGRFGKKRILQVLLGSKDKGVLNAGLQRLSTYGILQDPGEPAVSHLFREALEAGFLQVDSGKYPVVSLTERGEQVMKGAKDYRIVWPEESPAPSRQKASRESSEIHSIELSTEDRELFEALREKRRELAEEGKVPAYVIASDALLREIARQRPLTDQAALAIKGIGPAKLETYLRPLLEILSANPR